MPVLDHVHILHDDQPRPDHLFENRQDSCDPFVATPTIAVARRL